MVCAGMKAVVSYSWMISATPVMLLEQGRRHSWFCLCCQSSSARFLSSKCVWAASNLLLFRALTNMLHTMGVLLMAGRHASATHEVLWASPACSLPWEQSAVTNKFPIRDISIVTLIKTDTTFDHSRCVHVMIAAGGLSNSLNNGLLHKRCHGGGAKNCSHFSICACHPCAGAMLIFFCIVPILTNDFRRGSKYLRFEKCSTKTFDRDTQLWREPW